VGRDEEARMTKQMERAALEHARKKRHERLRQGIENARKKHNRQRPSLSMPCPRVVELCTIPPPQESRAISAFFKAFS
jgi:hypothetical protein